MANERPLGSYEAGPGDVGRVLLLYSGGLDTSVMLKWIQDEYGAEVATLTLNLGQPGEDYEVIEGKAKDLGAVECFIVDAREEFAEEYVLPAIKANALYGGGYPLFTALGRPLIAKIAVEKAREAGCDGIAHGCTGKGNDQVRLDSAVLAYAPDMKIVAPVRNWAMGREEEIAYAREHGIPVKGGTEAPPYSIDDNLWGAPARAARSRTWASRRATTYSSWWPTRARRPTSRSSWRSSSSRGGRSRSTASGWGSSSCSTRRPRSAAATASASSTTSRTGSSA